MYYTAISSAGRGALDQRIGLAESDDLLTWRRVGDRPPLTADPRWYKTLGVEDDPDASQTWRDPFVFRDPDGDGWHMLITARDKGAPRLDDGVIGHARSADMVLWELGPPISVPAGFGQIEVPQARLVDGGRRWSSPATPTCRPRNARSDQGSTARGPCRGSR